MKEPGSVREAEEALARTKAWESAKNRLLKAAEEVEHFGYTVTIVVKEIEDGE